MNAARPGPAGERPATGRTYVSRGGDKLAGALDDLGVAVAGRRALDAGASTGGFTDCLLRRAAAHVVAVDVAYGQLAWSLRNDPRVLVLERTNVRLLRPEQIDVPVDLVVADLSFISLTAVRDALVAACADEADLVLLVKPQFELPRGRVPRGGVVRDPEGWRDAMRAVSVAYRAAGCALLGATPSPLTGPKGNREFFLHLARRVGNGNGNGNGCIDAAVSEIVGAPR